jgi:hypothetical protein
MRQNRASYLHGLRNVINQNFQGAIPSAKLTQERQEKPG